MKPRGALAELVDRFHIHGRQLNKLDRLARKKPAYIFALLIAIASEGISLLRRWPEDAVFHRVLMSKRGVPEAVSADLFRAIRHGLAHRYDTNLIDVDGTQVVVVIAWRKPSSHLTVTEGDWLGDGKRRLGVLLDVQSMWAALDDYARKVFKATQHDPQLVKDSEARAHQLVRKYKVCVSAESIRAWRRFLATRTVDPRGPKGK